jgi:hypothetical protein
VLSIKKLKYLIILPIILAGCGISVRLYNKIATDSKVTVDKLAILAPFVAANYPTKETFIVGKSDTTTIHDTTTQTAIIYDTILKRYDSIKIKTIVLNRLVLRTDTIRIKEVAECYAINQRLLSAELKVLELKEWKKYFFLLIACVIAGIFITVILKVKNGNLKRLS